MAKMATEFYAPQYAPQLSFTREKPAEMHSIMFIDIKNPNSLTNLKNFEIHPCIFWQSECCNSQ